MAADIDRLGRSKLHLAAGQLCSAWKVQQLIDEGCDVNLQNKEGMTPLHFACQQHSYENALVLINAGAVIDLRDKYGNTPMSNAVFSCREADGKLIKLLRDRGADPYLKNDHGVSPLSLSRTIANYDVRRFFQDLPDEENPDGK
jgi:ankyrin repeat protein